MLESLRHDGYANLTGLDIDLDALMFLPSPRSICADAHFLPFTESNFDLCFCHFLLLWVKDPRRVLREMKRVTKKGGWVASLAEADYTARVDEPASLEALGRAQSKALVEQGADVGIGARLGELFAAEGLNEVETGVIAQEKPELFTDETFELEWAVLRRDLAGRMPEGELQRYYDIDRMASIRGERALYVPIHFAFGRAAGT